MTATDNLLNMDEAAKRLHVKPSTIRRWVFQRRVPYLKLGGCVRIAESDINALVEGARRPALRALQLGANHRSNQKLR